MLESPDKRHQPEFDKRMLMMRVALIVAFVLLGLRLWHLQVIRGDEYAERSEKQILHHQWLKAPRGPIYGQDSSVLLADTRAARDLLATPGLCRDREKAVSRRLTDLVDLDPARMLATWLMLEGEWGKSRKVVVRRDLSPDELARVRVW